MLEFEGSTAQEIADNIRRLIAGGRLHPGDSLPPVRDLAATLGVNRNTVAAAYQRLVKAGLAETRGRHGTVIATPPRAGEAEGRSGDTTLHDLADGNPNSRWLPDLHAIPLKRRKPMVYGDPTMLPELRRHAQTWLGPDVPAACEVEATSGAVDAIERLSAARLAPGDRVAVEDPCYLGTINALRLAGMRSVGIAMDGEGMLPDALEGALASGVRAVLLTPRSQNPTGASLTRRRAQALQKTLARYPDVFVMIDDHFALLCEVPYYSVIPKGGSHWALIRSVSKALGPDLRVAMLACDADTASRLRARLAPGIGWVSHILQSIALHCLENPRIRQQVSDAGADYRKRHAALRDALEARGIDARPACEGLNLWIPVDRDGKDVAFDLAKRGWLVRSSEVFDVQATSQAIRITTAVLDTDLVERLADDIARVLGA
ncbi:MAG: Vitamin B6 salvage pathway transcriptional repressor PtsJ [Luteibacter sp.]|uniref:MocR-like B6 salvage transcription factor PtsJ n=1 Tax=Luteibacter sp. TaxID=1886636 RepID=UPI00137FE0E7|nr:transcriptional regulator PtsJ [Luteibacter sp.]KAF1006182.1 MAG: Vitamin B6 salvage pathway transcriptional repressor PtsJ [Luteibacter sp.]